MEEQSGNSNIGFKTILVVDDETVIRNFVSTLLSQKGYNILVAENAEDALAKAKDYEGIIHLMLSNIQMPGMNGMELATKLNVERPDTRVMLMSGFTSGMLVLNDGWHFLSKPFIPSQLLHLVSSILASTSPAVPNLNEHKIHRAGDKSVQ